MDCKKHIDTNAAKSGIIGSDEIIELRCACHNLPYARIDAAHGILIIVSQHHGEKCINYIPLLKKEIAPMKFQTEAEMGLHKVRIATDDGIFEK